MVVGYVIEMIKQTEKVRNRLTDSARNQDESRNIKISIDDAMEFDRLLEEEIDRLKCMEVKNE